MTDEELAKLRLDFMFNKRVTALLAHVDALRGVAEGPKVWTQEMTDDETLVLECVRWYGDTDAGNDAMHINRARLRARLADLRSAALGGDREGGRG
jgi:hypothetical protein